MDKEKLERMKQWAESIPIDELFKEIKKLTGLSDLIFSTEVNISRNNNVIISFESQDLVDRVGFLKLIFSSIKIKNFSSSVTTKITEEGKEEYRYWGSASFDYTHPSGGSNGCCFLDYWYNEETGWNYRTS